MYLFIQTLLIFLSALIPLSLQYQPQDQLSMSSKPTIYFGYGSNLWLHQMSIRCPSSQYLGIARLRGYKWLINDRGYANVVEIESNSTVSTSSSYDNVVFGMVYNLNEEDEKKLDKNEGVPIAYTKELLECDFWSAGKPSAPMDKHSKVEVSNPPTTTQNMLVYIDRQRMTPDVPRKEYVYRMNRGIDDALKLGVPGRYVEGVMRKFIPADDGGEDGKDMEEFAARQAAQFRDESGVFR
jgi:gamma-glutamylcyclotransferase